MTFYIFYDIIGHAARIVAKRGALPMDNEKTRVALISIIVDRGASVDELNGLLHKYAGNVIGRMGIPYEKKGVNIICVALDAPQDVINSLAGALGRLEGVTAKATYAKPSGV